MEDVLGSDFSELPLERRLMFRIPSPQLLNSLEDDFMSSFFGAMERDDVNLDMVQTTNTINRRTEDWDTYASFGRRAGLAPVLTEVLTVDRFDVHRASLPTPTGAYEIDGLVV